MCVVTSACVDLHLQLPGGKRGVIVIVFPCLYFLLPLTYIIDEISRLKARGNLSQSLIPMNCPTAAASGDGREEEAAGDAFERIARDVSCTVRKAKEEKPARGGKIRPGKKRSMHPLHLSISRICQDLNARGRERGDSEDTMTREDGKEGETGGRLLSHSLTHTQQQLIRRKGGCKKREVSM